MYYVAVDTGCIECGENTSVLGVFTNKTVAEEVIKEHEERQQKKWHGQHCFEVFEVKAIDEICKCEY